MAPRKTTQAKAKTTKAKPRATRAKKPAGARHPGAAPIEDAVPGAQARASRHQVIDHVVAAERDLATANRAPVPADQRGA